MHSDFMTALNNIHSTSRWVLTGKGLNTSYRLKSAMKILHVRMNGAELPDGHWGNQEIWSKMAAVAADKVFVF